MSMTLRSSSQSLASSLRRLAEHFFERSADGRLSNQQLALEIERVARSQQPSYAAHPAHIAHPRKPAFTLRSLDSIHDGN